MIGQQPKATPKPAGQVEYEFAKEQGFKGSYIDFVQAKKGKGVTVNVGQGESFKVPPGYMKGEDGKSVIPIPGGPSESKFSESQQRAVEAGVRVKRGLEVLDTPTEDGRTIFDTLGDLDERAKGTVPVAGNYMLSAEYQKAEQAMGDIAASLLRLETGAAAPEFERIELVKRYSPRPGDSPES